MNFFDEGYTHSEIEFEQMRSLLTNSYQISRQPFNWRLAMAENWNYASRYLEPLDFFTSRVHLWRNAAGELCGFLIRDYNQTCFQVSYACRSIENEMAEWAETHWGREEAVIHTMVYNWDTERQSLLAERGYENKGVVEDLHIYDLARTYPKAALPPGYQIVSMAEFDDIPARIELEKRTWNDGLDEAWFRGKASAPSYSPDWDLMVLSPQGKPIAACLVWLYRENHSAEIDPLGTHPDYRKQGFARALVLESFRRLHANGVSYAYIASSTENQAAGHLYTSLEPMKFYQGFHWRKQIT